MFSWGGTSAHEEMQKACFDYLALGGWYSEGPVSLLSGLNPRPSVLVLHFFAVAVYGFGRLQLPRPTLRCPTHVCGACAGAAAPGSAVCARLPGWSPSWRRCLGWAAAAAFAPPAGGGPARRGLWHGLLIIWCAACIIGPIIKAEGLRRTFFPVLATTAKVLPAGWPSLPQSSSACPAQPALACAGATQPGAVAARSSCAAQVRAPVQSQAGLCAARPTHGCGH